MKLAWKNDYSNQFLLNSKLYVLHLFGIRTKNWFARRNIESNFNSDILWPGLTSFFFGCSNYTFHGSPRPIFGLTWMESRRLCNLSGSDLVSIEEFKEWEFLVKAIQELSSMMYFIGLREDKRTRQWTWLSNGKSINASREEFPWAKGAPRNRERMNCVIMYKSYFQNFGRFDDFGCTQWLSDTGYICESTVACKDGKGRLRNCPLLCFLTNSLDMRRFKHITNHQCQLNVNYANSFE